MATKKAPPKKPSKPSAPAKKAAPPKKAPPKKPETKAAPPKKAPEKKAAPPKKAPPKKPEPEPAAEQPEVLTHLLEVTGQEPQADDEDDGDFKMRIATALSEMDEKAYNKKISDAGKAWYSAACEAAEAEKDLPDFEDSSEEEGNEEASEDEGGEEGGGEEEAPEEEEVPAPAKKAAPSKKGKKDDDETEAAPPSKSGSSIARIIVCENPDISLEDLKAELKKRKVGITDSQAHAVHNMTTRVLKVLKSLGKLK